METGLRTHGEGLSTDTAKSVLPYNIYSGQILVYWYIVGPLTFTHASVYKGIESPTGSSTCAGYLHQILYKSSLVLNQFKTDYVYTN